MMDERRFELSPEFLANQAKSDLNEVYRKLSLKEANEPKIKLKYTGQVLATHPQAYELQIITSSNNGHSTANLYIDSTGQEPQLFQNVGMHALKVEELPTANVKDDSVRAYLTVKKANPRGLSALEIMEIEKTVETLKKEVADLEKQTSANTKGLAGPLMRFARKSISETYNVNTAVLAEKRKQLENLETLKARLSK